MDIVGPLPISNGYRYLLTCVDRFSRWPEAIPMADITARTITETFLSGWIARHGVPVSVTTHRGRQFESTLFNNFCRKFGIKRIRTTAYHPSANGMVERLHRQLKASLRCCDNAVNWISNLPLVLLGLRTSYREDLKASTAELQYGTTLRLPCDFIQAPDLTCTDPTDFIDTLRISMRNLRHYSPRKPRDRKVFISQDLKTCKYVFIRRDAIADSLTPTYLGPYRIVSRSMKFFTLDIEGKEDNVSIDRLKPAFVAEDVSISSADDFCDLPHHDFSIANSLPNRFYRRVHFA
jgi:hypothetical protein